MTLRRRRKRTVRRRYLAYQDRMPVIIMPHVCVERKCVLVAMMEPKESLRNPFQNVPTEALWDITAC